MIVLFKIYNSNWYIYLDGVVIGIPPKRPMILEPLFYTISEIIILLVLQTHQVLQADQPSATSSVTLSMSPGPHHLQMEVLRSQVTSSRDETPPVRGGSRPTTSPSQPPVIPSSTSGKTQSMSSGSWLRTAWDPVNHQLCLREWWSEIQSVSNGWGHSLMEQGL